MIKFAFRVFFLTGSLTALAVLYVYGQTEIFKVSYDINERSDQLAEQSELHRRLKFEVDQLRAPRLLEEKMKRMELELALPSEIQVVRIPQVSKDAEPFDSAAVPQSLAPNPFDLLGRVVKVAQAKMDQ
ncbi:MAG: hypothetical protein FGM27_06770 [Candidatus Omnitrophica bacterium]|nr:hypothetical protein [Candidatus Omnitrophota bacterium]